MKKIFKIAFISITVVFALLIAIPLLFQDKIIALVKETVNNNINAEFNFTDANLSLLRDFPKASVALENASIINKAPFKGDTLLYAKDINLSLKLTELFKSSSEQLQIASFTIEEALVNVLVNKKGIANYSITKPSEENSTNTENSSSGFGLSINSYAIKNSLIKYTDKKEKTTVVFRKFNHSGSGDFSQKKSKLTTSTSALVSLGKEKDIYLDKQEIGLDAVFGMDLETSKFSFLKNEARINNLKLIFDGFVQLQDNEQEIHLNFNTPTSDFKNFLGLVPAQYAKNISTIKTSGNCSITGKVDGVLNELSIPKFAIAIVSENASFKYPDLPKSVEKIHINTQINNTTGKVKDTYVALKKLTFKIDEDVFSANGTVRNITTNPHVNATVNGTLNLENLSKAYPVASVEKMQGILKADLHTQFDAAAVQKNAVDRIKNNGTISLNNFIFSSKDVVNPLHINTAKVVFTPSTIKLNAFEAKSGKSDFNATGKIENLLGFLFSNKELQGNFTANSSSFHISDFMQENTKEAPSETKESSIENLKIPAFLNCNVQANAAKVYYDNLVLNNVKGQLLLKDEKAILKNVNASIFKGNISLNGEVNTQKETPKFAMDLGIKSFDIAQSFISLDLLQALSPIANAMDGKLNAGIKLSGDLKKDFTPNLASISGDALAELLATKVNPEKTKTLSLLNNKLSFLDLNSLNLSDIKTHLSFKDGKVNVKPFTLNYKDIGVTIGGSHGFDQNMNYTTTFNVPAKYLGGDVQKLLAKVSNKDITIPVTATIGGNVTKPNVTTNMSSAVNKLTQKLIAEQKDKLIGGALNSLLGNKKKDSNEKSDTKKSGDKTKKDIKKVTDVLGGLFGKKKK